MLGYQLCTPAAWLASRLHSPASLVWAISLSNDLGLDFNAQTNLLLLINIIMEHTCQWTRIDMDGFLKKQISCVLQMFGDPKSFWIVPGDSSAVIAPSANLKLKSQSDVELGPTMCAKYLMAGSTFQIRICFLSVLKLKGLSACAEKICNAYYFSCLRLLQNTLLFCLKQLFRFNFVEWQRFNLVRYKVCSQNSLPVLLLPKPCSPGIRGHKETKINVCPLRNKATLYEDGNLKMMRTQPNYVTERETSAPLNPTLDKSHKDWVLLGFLLFFIAH